MDELTPKEERILNNVSRVLSPSVSLGSMVDNMIVAVNVVEDIGTEQALIHTDIDNIITNTETLITNTETIETNVDTVISNIESIESDLEIATTNTENINESISGVHDSTSITSNRDGSLEERTEFIIDSLLGAPPVRVTQSLALAVSEGTFSYFNVQIYDVDGNPYLEVDIDITLGTLVLEKSTLGGPFLVVGITQPLLQKGLGHIDTSVLFKTDEWIPDDLYRLTLSNITVVNGVTHTLQTFVWNNYVTIINDIDNEVDAILEHITVTAIDNTNDESIADIIGTKGDTPKTDIAATIMNNLKALFASSLSKRINISQVINPTSFKSTDFPALGSGGLIGWYVYCSLDAGGLGAAPQGEYRLITNWINGADGVFTHEAFSTLLTTSDKVIIVHPSIYNMIIMMPEIEKIQSIKTSIEAISGYALDSTVAKTVELDLVKNETDKIAATITKLDNLILDINYQQRVYPSLSNGVIISGPAGSWVETVTPVQIVPVNGITNQFRITNIHLFNLSANDTYEISLYSGTIGNEVEISRTLISKTLGGIQVPIIMNTNHIPANTRISGKIATSSGNDSVTLAIIYHYS